MKLSMSNIAWTEEKDSLIYSILRENGFTGLEIAPTRIFPKDPYDKIDEAKNWAKNLNFEIPSMQSIWYGRTENIFKSEEQREILLNYSIKALKFAQAINCKNLVFGCPKNRNITDGSDPSSALEFLQKIAEESKKCGAVFSVEANPKIYGTNFINKTEEALDLVKKINHPNFLVNLDTGTMINNNEDAKILKGNVEYINHVHISEPYLKPIEKRKLHREIFEILKSEDYRGYISIEIANTTDTKIIEDTIKYVGEIFK